MDSLSFLLTALYAARLRKSDYRTISTARSMSPEPPWINGKKSVGYTLSPRCKYGEVTSQ